MLINGLFNKIETLGIKAFRDSLSPHISRAVFYPIPSDGPTLTVKRFSIGLGCQNHLFYKVFIVSMMRFELAIFGVIL
jgi:hypothetical protein